MNITVPIAGYPYDSKRHDKESRKPYELEENQTFGYLPKPYWNDQEGYGKVVSILRIQIQPMNNLTRAVDLVETFSEEIGNHMEWKIQCFFTQLLMSHGSGLKFSHDGAYFQAGIRRGSKQIKNRTINQLVEAHIATLPSLLAVSKSDYEEALIEGKKVTSIVFADGSYIGRVLAAATSSLPRCVNDADSSFEFKKKMIDPLRGNFRDFCIKLLDLSGEGRLSPEKGLGSFLNRAIRFIDLANPESNPDYMKRIFAIYKKVVEKYLELIKEKDTFKKLSFGVKPQQIRLKMTQEVTAQKELHKLVALVGKVEAKIALISLTSSEQTLYFERKVQSLTKTGWKHLETCLSNEAFREECLDFLRDKTVQQLKEDEPTSEIVVDAVKKNATAKQEILHRGLLVLSREVFEVPEGGKAVRQFLLANDAWVESQLKGKYALRDRVNLTKQNPEVKRKVKQIAELLLPNPE